MQGPQVKALGGRAGGILTTRSSGSLGFALGPVGAFLGKSRVLVQTGRTALAAVQE